MSYDWIGIKKCELILFLQTHIILIKKNFFFVKQGDATSGERGDASPGVARAVSVPMTFMDREYGVGVTSVGSIDSRFALPETKEVNDDELPQIPMKRNNDENDDSRDGNHDRNKLKKRESNISNNSSFAGMTVKYLM